MRSRNELRRDRASEVPIISGQNKTLMKLGLGAILSAAIISGYYGCGGGGSSSSSDSGSSVPLFSTGVLDATFGTAGVVTTTIGSGYDSINTIAIQSDGKIVAAGYSSNGVDDDITLDRYNSNGAIDTTFGTGGVLTTDIAGDSEYANGIVLQADNKIVVGGISYNGADNDIVLTRYWR